MGERKHFADIKAMGCTCCACFCVDHSLVPPCAPTCCLVSGKALCLKLKIMTECPPIACGCCEPCCSEEQGCCDQRHKCCCLYSEVQYPPGPNIGLGCCGCVCCRSEPTRALKQ